MYGHSSYGPTFGAGHDICIDGNMKSHSNRCNPNSFTNVDPISSPGIQCTSEILAGSTKFCVEEIEVFAIES
jgi:hypothetical protein